MMTNEAREEKRSDSRRARCSIAERNSKMDHKHNKRTTTTTYARDVEERRVNAHDRVARRADSHRRLTLRQHRRRRCRRR
jgi:hypothetical protein